MAATVPNAAVPVADPVAAGAEAAGCDDFEDGLASARDFCKQSKVIFADEQIGVVVVEKRKLNDGAVAWQLSEPLCQ